LLDLLDRALPGFVSVERALTCGARFNQEVVEGSPFRLVFGAQRVEFPYRKIFGSLCTYEASAHFLELLERLDR